MLLMAWATTDRAASACGLKYKYTLLAQEIDESAEIASIRATKTARPATQFSLFFRLVV